MAVLLPFFIHLFSPPSLLSLSLPLLPLFPAKKLLRPAAGQQQRCEQAAAASSSRQRRRRPAAAREPVPHTDEQQQPGETAIAAPASSAGRQQLRPRFAIARRLKLLKTDLYRSFQVSTDDLVDLLSSMIDFYSVG